MVGRWNNLTVAYEDPEFLDKYNRVIGDESIPNGEDDNKTDDEEKEDTYVNMELGLPRKNDNRLMHALVKRRKLDGEVKAVGNINNNSLLGTRAYKIEFDEVMTEFLTAKIISNNLLVQVDEEVHRQMLLDDIIDHGQDANAIGNEHAFAKTPNGMKRIKMTTADLQLCIQWRDVSTDWVALKDIKQ